MVSKADESLAPDIHHCPDHESITYGGGFAIQFNSQICPLFWYQKI